MGGLSMGEDSPRGIHLHGESAADSMRGGSLRGYGMVLRGSGDGSCVVMGWCCEDLGMDLAWLWDGVARIWGWILRGVVLVDLDLVKSDKYR